MPHRPRAPFAALRAAARPVAWAMALLIVAQGATVAVLRAVGPAHRHAVRAVAAPMLDDVRRAPRGIDAATVSLAAAVAHGHFHNDVARHHHARRDATVVFVDGELRVADGTGDDGSAASATSAFVALPHADLAFVIESPRSQVAPTRAWSMQTHDPEHPERPPRPA